MQKPPFPPPFQLISLALFLLLSSHVPHSVFAAAGTSRDNPFTPKAYLIRYWNNNIYKVPRPDFLISKASPLSAADAATFARLASSKALSSRLPSFCRSAHLLCFPDLRNTHHHPNDGTNFANYVDQKFTNYGTNRKGSTDTFLSYSPNQNIAMDTFRSYSRNSVSNNDKFAHYAPDGNVITETFNTYGTHAVAGNGEFKHYADDVNAPTLFFGTYSDTANSRIQSFHIYSEESNSGAQNFANYGKNGSSAESTFSSYSNDSNVISSGFSSYSQGSNVGKDRFKSYGVNGNVPETNFKNYGRRGNGVLESFTRYRDQANVGDDTFTSYARDSNDAEVKFANYGQSVNPGTDAFNGYGQGANNVKEIDFKTYTPNATFKVYSDDKPHGLLKRDAVSFDDYNKTRAISSESSGVSPQSGKAVNRWVEPGKFFREKMLRRGVVMPMPDIKDKMPQRAFLPRSIASKIPFSSSKIQEMKAIFHAVDNSTTESMILSALGDCERAPSRGETKRCVGSAEDMIDFAVSVLGRSAELRTTENVNGAKRDVMIGDVKGINDGNVTKSVSCHQSLYPYLLYYCHSVPRVRVYEADILDPISKARINHGVAICHLDTSDWSPTHGAFLSLGSGPGKIEVCHWIFENDLTWTVAD